jgi:hypothetical protein
MYPWNTIANISLFCLIVMASIDSVVAPRIGCLQALKQFGKELPDRWERIAGVVPGKGKAACFKRFKELRDVFRAKKDGPA